MGMNGSVGYKTATGTEHGQRRLSIFTNMNYYNTTKICFWRVLLGLVLIFTLLTGTQSATDSEMTGNSESGFLWFGPRLGRRDPTMRLPRPAAQPMDPEQSRRLAELWQWQRNAGYA